jgi:hypothetical protein
MPPAIEPWCKLLPPSAPSTATAVRQAHAGFAQPGRRCSKAKADGTVDDKDADGTADQRRSGLGVDQSIAQYQSLIWRFDAETKGEWCQAVPPDGLHRTDQPVNLALSIQQALGCADVQYDGAGGDIGATAARWQQNIQRILL